MNTLLTSFLKPRISVILIMFTMIASVKSQASEDNFLQLLNEAYNPLKSNTINGTLQKSDIKHNRHTRILHTNGKMIRGKLVAMCSEGVFISDVKYHKVHYIRYNNIEKIKLGRSYGFFVNGISIAGGFIGGLIISDYSVILFPVGAILGYGVTATYGQVFYALPYAVYKEYYKLNYEIEGSSAIYNEVFKEAEFNNPKFGNPDFYNIQKTETETPKTKNTEISDNSNTSTKESENNIAVQENPSSVVTTPKTNNFMTGLKFGDNKSVEAKWMVHEFNNAKIKETELQTAFKNIRGMQLTREQLSKYSTSQIQFLALMICSGGGYNMKELVTLSDEQRKVLGFYESGYLEDLKVDGMVQTVNLADIDIENLRVIFDELSSR